MERADGSQILVLSGFPGGGCNSFLDIQGIEAYRGLINKNDTQKCAALLCSFKKKHFNHNKSELVSSLLQCKVERNKCSKADLTAPLTRRQAAFKTWVTSERWTCPPLKGEGKCRNPNKRAGFVRPLP